MPLGMVRGLSRCPALAAIVVTRGQIVQGFVIRALTDRGVGPPNAIAYFAIVAPTPEQAIAIVEDECNRRGWAAVRDAGTISSETVLALALANETPQML